MTITPTPQASLVTPDRRAEIVAWFAAQPKPAVRDCGVVLVGALDIGDGDLARATIGDAQVALGFRRSPGDDQFLTTIYSQV